MNAGTVVFIVVVLVIIGGAAVLIARRPRRGVELEPPARPQAPSPTSTAEAPPAKVDEATIAELEEALDEAPPEAPPEAPAEVAVKPSLRERLTKARALFGEYVGSVLSRSKIDNETWDDLEEALIRADVGVGPTTDLLDAVRARVKDENITEPAALVDAMKQEIEKRLAGDRTLRFEPGQPNVWLFVGVNGVGKTTTIGKVGKRAKSEGHSRRDGGGRHVPCRGRRAARAVGRTGRRGHRPRKRGRRSELDHLRRRPARRCARHRPRARRHRRPAAHEDEPHGGAAQGSAGRRP